MSYFTSYLMFNPSLNVMPSPMPNPIADTRLPASRLADTGLTDARFPDTQSAALCQTLEAAMDQAEASLTLCVPIQIEALELWASHALHTVPSVPIDPDQARQLAPRVQALEHLLQLTESNMAILERSLARRRGTVLTRHGRRFDPWQP